MHDPTRRDILAASAVALFAQQAGQAETGARFYEKGPVRIAYQEAGSGFPLLLIAGGGLNSNITGITGDYPPFNAIKEFSNEYRCVA